MNTTDNNTKVPFRTRLIAFVVVLVVGLALGWFNGTGDTDAASGIVATQQVATAADTDDEATDSTAPTDDPTGDATTDEAGTTTVSSERGPTVAEDGWYTSKDEVALYIHTYGRLPGNFISKTKARAAGWVASEGNLDEVCPGKSIGGSRFYNDDGLLPDARGRTWTECDINYHGGFRGAERIVFSSDGLLYYTGDHYETFERLY